MIVYLIIFSVLLCLEILYIKFAEANNIKDIPNHRSAHRSPTVRGGGIVIILSLLIYTILNYPLQDNLFILVTVSTLVAIVSFIDDMIVLSSKIRILVHIVGILLLFTSIFTIETPAFNRMLILGLLFVFSLGIMNIYNFMDGINGITFLNALVSYLTLYYINENYLLFTDSKALIFLMLAVLVFGFFNFRRKAACFCGDIGSITIGFTLLYFTLSFYNKTNNPILFFLFSVYLIDGGLTIMQRLFNKENIFEAHKKHLYQRLSNERNIDHLVVASIYFIFQLMVNILVIVALAYNLSVFFLIFLTFLYVITYFVIKKRIISI